MIISILFSLPIYLSHLGIENRVLNSILAISAIYLLINAKRFVWFISGGLIALFWFWWIGLSFIHYKMPYLVVPIDIIVALVYATLFFSLAFFCEKFNSIYIENLLKSISIYLLSIIHPFGFDWFKPQILFTHSYFGVSDLDFLLILLSLYLLSIKKLYTIPISIVLLILSIDTSSVKTNYNNPKDIYIAYTDVPIEKKWNPKFLKPQLQDIFFNIDRAINQSYKIIILPESVIPLFLNREPILMDMLKSRSKQITIIIGALYLDNGVNRNSAFIFKDGNLTVANKTILVPFGESNPLPKFLSKLVNRLFFDGAPDYLPASTPTDIIIDNKTYRVAICYEGTSEKMYKGIKRLIVISNNAWFTPSIEPTLQRLLMEYYARRYKVDIYHSINGSSSLYIEPFIR